MKKTIILSLVVLGLAACAYHRSSASDNATTWERIKYQTGAATEAVRN